MNFNWKPFAVLAAVIIVLFLIGIAFLSIFGAGRYSGGPWMMGPWMMGMGFFWIFPIIGILIMLTFMFIFFNMMAGWKGGPMDWMRQNGPRDNPNQSPIDALVHVCPSCGSAVQTDWNVCPHCGTDLKK